MHGRTWCNELHEATLDALKNGMEANINDEEAANGLVAPEKSSNEAVHGDNDDDDDSDESEEEMSETSEIENNDVEHSVGGSGRAKRTLPVKPPPTLDVTVHRLRHLNYHPKPVLCLASTLSGGGLLALTRDSGAVELKRARKLRTVATIAGYRQKPVNALVWLPSTDDGTTAPAELAETSSPSRSRSESELPPLIGASRDGTVFCVDFSRLCLTDISPSGGGGVFALTTKFHREFTQQGGNASRSSSASRNKSGRARDEMLFAAGCQDGSTRIWKYSPSASDASASSPPTRLAVVSTVPSAGAPILSLAWSPNAMGIGGSTLYAAAADGTIRMYEEDQAAPLRWSASLRITVESMGRATPTRVWALELLSDGTLVSADSLGHVQFWEGRTGTLQQTIDQNDSKADVLCLAVSEDESVVFASGVDSRVICIERVPLTKRMQTDYYGPIRRWAPSYAQRPHTHDVNALAIVRQALRKNLAPSEKRSEDLQQILCSAGVDTKLCTYPVHEGTKKRPKTLYPWPSNLVSLARELRIFIVMREETIDVYQLGPKCSMDTNFPISVPPERTALGTVRVEGISNLVCSAISDDGKYLALSDASSVSIFQLEFDVDGELILCMHQPQKIAIDSDEAFAATAMQFHGSQNDLICCCHDGMVRILRTSNLSEESSMARVEQIAHSNGFDGLTSGAMQSIALTRDGEFLATMQTVPCTMIEVYRATRRSTEPEGLIYRHWWTVPPLEMSPCVISFLLTGKPQLAVACLNFTAYVFDVHERKLSPWSEAAGYPIRNLPPEFLHRSDYPVHITVNPASPSKFLVASCGAFVVFDVDKPFPCRCRMFPDKHVRGKKHKRPRPGEEGEVCTLCLRYNSMLSLEFVSANELFIVEQPWLSVVATFPEALQRKVYGT